MSRVDSSANGGVTCEMGFIFSFLHLSLIHKNSAGSNIDPIRKLQP